MERRAASATAELLVLFIFYFAQGDVNIVDVNELTLFNDLTIVVAIISVLCFILLT